MSPRLDIANLPTGTVLLGKYRVEHTIGVGGMGVVVACHHRTLGTRVALKFLLPRLVSDRAVARRFVREAQAANRIHSEHVARIMDVDQLPNGLPFIVMEYLEGNNIAAHLAAGRTFSIPEALDLAVQAAEAIAQAHRVGVIHRDVKPSNLFLVEAPGEPLLLKIVDFGISKITGQAEAGFQQGLTETSTVLGSGLYMSPEQMRSAKDVDGRTDIYGLGLCLYELLTHTLPYVADNFADLCVKVQTEPPVPMRHYRPDVPEALARAIARAYAVQLDERYGSPADFALALAPFVAPPTRVLIEAVQQLGTRAVGETPLPPALAQTVVERVVKVPSEPPTAATRIEGRKAGAGAGAPAIASTSSSGSLSLRSTAAEVGRRVAPWAAILACVVLGVALAAWWFNHHAPAAPATSVPALEPSSEPRSRETPGASEPTSPVPVTGPDAAAAEPEASATDEQEPPSATRGGSVRLTPRAVPSGEASALPSASAAPSTEPSAAAVAPAEATATAQAHPERPEAEGDVRCLTTDPVTGEQKQVPCN